MELTTRHPNTNMPSSPTPSSPRPPPNSETTQTPSSIDQESKLHNTPHSEPSTFLSSTPPSNNSTITQRKQRRRRKKKQVLCCPSSGSTSSGSKKDTSYARGFLKGTLSFMNFLARVLLWGSVAALAAGVIWYSRELIINGTDPHLIAWFSAGAFVLLGFPISIYSIFTHLSNYYQPNIQCYVVRILWMVPIYSIESWLCLRFHDFSLYIETLRDCYESYVLYCFLQFLIEVLGGEEELILMLKDKSPTRGVHFAPLNWCFPPWIMGQPIQKQKTKIRWSSPFFLKCKLGVLQYVLLKNLCAFLTMILELHGLYKEGDFNPKNGYLYICIVTNISQCWALYCLAFFYYATKNELSPIRPVGKFLAVKMLVFFTWWQSLFISILFQCGWIPSYDEESQWSAEDVAKGLQDYLICVEMFLAAIVHTFVFPHTDYLLSARRLMGESGGNGKRGVGGEYGGARYHRLGRKRRFQNRGAAAAAAAAGGEKLDGKEDKSLCGSGGVLTDGESVAADTTTSVASSEIPNLNYWNDEMQLSYYKKEEEGHDDEEAANSETSSLFSTDPEEEEEDNSPKQKPKAGFVSAFLDSTVPRDVMDNTVGIVKGDFHVEKKTLLHHATTSDEYDLFSKRRRVQRHRQMVEMQRIKEREIKEQKGKETDSNDDNLMIV